MLSLLFDLTIAPIQLWMDSALEYAYKLTASYGWSIVLMSLVVNFIILPIYIQAERWQENERKIKNSISEKEKMIKRAFKGQERFAMISTLYRQAGYSPFLALRSSLGFFLQIPFFCAAYLYLSELKELQGIHFWIIQNLGAPDSLLSIGNYSINFLPILMTVINLFSAFIYTEGLGRKDKVQLVAMAILFLVLLYDSPSGLVLYWTCNNIFSLCKNIAYKEGSKFNLFKYFKPNANKNSQEKLYWILGVFVGVILCFGFPIQLMRSDPTVFLGWNQDLIFLMSVFQLWIVLLFALKILFFQTNLGPKVFISLLTFISIYIIFYGYIIVPNFGVIDNFVIQDQRPFTVRFNLTKDVLVFGFSLFLIVAIFRFRLWKPLTVISSFLLLFALSSSGWDLVQHNKQINIISSKWTEGLRTQKEVLSDILSFSKEKNIIIIMLDMFSGIHFEEILKKYPFLYKTLSGFYYFPDTTSFGTSTLFGKAPIIGGPKLSPKNLLKGDGLSLEKKINAEYESLFKELRAKDWNITFHENMWLKPNLIPQKIREKSYLLTDQFMSPVFFHDWEKDKGVNLTKKNFKPSFFLAFSVFRIAPLKIKKNIYKNGTWLTTVDDNYRAIENAKRYSQLLYLSKHSQVNNTSKSFKFITNESTHFPWAMNNKCEPMNVTEGQAVFSPAMQLQNEYCAIKALGEWFGWMKKKEVYNNSMIVIVSDHGRTPQGKFSLPPEGISFQDYKAPKLVTPFGYGSSALLLVKPFNSTGKLKIEKDQLMVNSDVRLMIEKAIDDENVLSNFDHPVRETFSGNWRREAHPSDKFTNLTQGQVKGDQYDSNNWKVVPSE